MLRFPLSRFSRAKQAVLSPEAVWIGYPGEAARGRITRHADRRLRTDPPRRL